MTVHIINPVTLYLMRNEYEPIRFVSRVDSILNELLLGLCTIKDGRPEMTSVGSRLHDGTCRKV